VKELSDQVRGIIFIVVVLLITFIWVRFFRPPAPPLQPTQTAPISPAQPAHSPSATQKASAPAAHVTLPVVQAAGEKITAIESPLYRVEFSNRGAVVKSWTLKKYFDEQTPPHPLDIVNAPAAQELGWPFSVMLSDTQLEAEANSGLYQVTAKATDGDLPESQLNDIQTPVTLTFHWSNGRLDVTKKLSFEQGYQLAIEQTVMLDGAPIPSAVAWRGGFGDKAIRNAPQLVTVFYQQNSSLTLAQYRKLGTPGNQVQPFEQPGPLEFAGLEDQFFAAAFVPDSSDFALWHWTQWHHFTSNNQQLSEPEAEMAAGSATPGPAKLRAYVGPKDLGLLRQMRPSLEGLVNFGWFGIIAKALLFTLQWLHRYIPNWGWAIIVLTLVINFALFPLKIKSFSSMKEMQKIAPEMRQIQDRYKKYSMTDPRRRKMQDEMTELYQKHGINPLSQLGGCLPMIVQLPVWWSLWRVLTGAIELRHAPWIGWIHDLSVRDPYYILPIAMAITMYLMTKMTPQSAAIDPSQQKMMALMPLAFAAFFFTYASGLNLYMFTSNLVGVGQQWYLNRTSPMPSRSKFKNKKQQQ
jgi:YidC/Oxa1 family membrane protein insertase